MRDVLSTQLRFLTFRFRPEDAASLGRRHLAFGLVVTWLVGIGRWWDDPGAHLVQHLGLGSVIYVLVLAGLLWLPLTTLRPQGGSYRVVLTAVCLTALPGLLYAIPVERWTSLPTARRLNLGFLAVVAAWRLAAWLAFLVQARVVPWWAAAAATLLPVGGVIVALAMLNLERVVFDFMAGLREPGGPNDSAYSAILYATWLVVLASPALLLAWIAAIVARHRRPRAAKPG